MLLGSTSFDGFSRSSTWQDLLGDFRAELAGSSQRTVDLATTFLNLGGLAFFVAAILATYLAAVAAAEKLGRLDRSLVPDFVLPLVPIAAAYLAAHYFTLFLIQGQFVITLALGSVRARLGPLRDGRLRAESRDRLARDGVVRAGRRARGRARRGLAIAHDRAVAVFQGRRTALEAQLPMLGADGALHARRHVAANAWLAAHGGIPGAIVEASIALAVVGVLVWAWLRERRRGTNPA